jgi:hypothetical protein
MNGPLAVALCHAFFESSALNVVRSFAQHVLASTGHWTPPIDPEVIAGALGLPVERRNNIEAEGFLENWPGRKGGEGTRIVLRAVPISPSTGERCRERFTIAHEIGHYVIRERLLGWYPIDSFRIDDPEEEFLCNRFAAELLMPIGQFLPKIRSAKNNPRAFLAVAEYFEVSHKALLRHAASCLPNKIIALCWQRGQTTFKPTWCAPRRMTPSLLCDNGETSVEKAAQSGEVAFGLDTFLIAGSHQRWNCGTMVLRNGELLTVGARDMPSAEHQRPATPVSAPRERKPVQLPLRFNNQPIAAARRSRAVPDDLDE